MTHIVAAAVNFLVWLLSFLDGPSDGRQTNWIHLNRNNIKDLIHCDAVGSLVFQRQYWLSCKLWPLFLYVDSIWILYAHKWDSLSGRRQTKGCTHLPVAHSFDFLCTVQIINVHCAVCSFQLLVVVGSLIFPSFSLLFDNLTSLCQDNRIFLSYSQTNRWQTEPTRHCIACSIVNRSSR